MDVFEGEFEEIISEKQLAANRANALKSTGPRTEAGKVRSSRNALRHTALARSVLLRCESADRFRAFVDNFHHEFRPRTATEITLVNTMATARWRLMRLSHVESANIDLEYVRQIDPAVVPEDYGVSDKAALAYRDVARNSRVLDLVARSEARLQRQFDSALNSLVKLRKARGAIQDEAAHEGEEIFLPDTPGDYTL
jgi:hypothetical protein